VNESWEDIAGNDNSFHVVAMEDPGEILNPVRADGQIGAQAAQTAGPQAGPITASTVLDGFTITAGTSSGGGMRCKGDDGGTCSPRLANLHFSGNGTGSTSSGGALYNDGSDGGTSSPVLFNIV